MTKLNAKLELKKFLIKFCSTTRLNNSSKLCFSNYYIIPVQIRHLRAVLVSLFHIVGHSKLFLELKGGTTTLKSND